MEIRLSEIVAALSHALDVTGGQPRGHAQRTCLIGLRVGDAIDLPSAQRSSLFYALLLKDAGCSVTASTTAAVFGGDDDQIKRELRLVDETRPGELARYLARSVAPGAGLRTRARHLRRVVALGGAGSRQLSALRCERGADIARMVELEEETARAIAEIFERWDGSGHPAGLAGQEISILGRVVCLAQTMEIFWQHGGASAACAVARERRGTWFDPALVDAIAAFERDDAFWHSLADPDVEPVEPTDRVEVANEDRLDRVAEAFASVVDAKSPFTASHSAGVAEIAEAVAKHMGLDPVTRRLIRRAGLLHDIGKLGVSNRILDKTDRLDEEEWRAVRAHPGLSQEILTPVAALREVARIAAVHHERLDGSGYPWGLPADRLDLPSRVLQAADVAEALTAERPYRAALSADEALAILRDDAGLKLDGTCFEALEGILPERARDLAADRAARLGEPVRPTARDDASQRGEQPVEVAGVVPRADRRP